MTKLWIPEAYCDEVTPPGRPHPSDWLDKPVGDMWALVQEDGYGPVHVRHLEAVGFHWVEDHGQITVKIAPDGGFSTEDPVPDASHFWAWGDPDTLEYSLADFCRQYADQAADCPDDLADPIPVSCARWSDDAVKFRLLVDADGNARFVEAKDEEAAP